MNLENLGQYGAEMVDTLWYWVSRRRYWLVLGGTCSVWYGTGWYLVLLGQYNLVLLGIKWYWVDMGKDTRKDRATEPLDHGRLR